MERTWDRANRSNLVQMGFWDRSDVTSERENLGFHVSYCVAVHVMTMSQTKKIDFPLAFRSCTVLSTVMQVPSRTHQAAAKRLRQLLEGKKGGGWSDCCSRDSSHDVHDGKPIALTSAICTKHRDQRRIAVLPRLLGWDVLAMDEQERIPRTKLERAQSTNS